MTTLMFWDSNLSGPAVYCKWHRYVDATKSLLLSTTRLSFESPLSMTPGKVYNSKTIYNIQYQIGYPAYLIKNLSDTVPVWYWRNLIPLPNLADTEPIRHQTYQISRFNTMVDCSTRWLEALSLRDKEKTSCIGALLHQWVPRSVFRPPSPRIVAASLA